MKKLKVFIMTFIVLLLFSFKMASACLCFNLDLDQAVSDSDNQVFMGTIEKVLSKSKVIIRVDQNLSENTIDKYVLVTAGDPGSNSCGVDLSDLGTNQLLVEGIYKNGALNTGACSIAIIYNDTVQKIKFDETEYDHVHISQVTQYMTTTYQIGEIHINKISDINIEEEKDLKTEKEKDNLSYVYYGVGGIAIISASYILYKVLKKK